MCAYVFFGVISHLRIWYCSTFSFISIPYANVYSFILFFLEIRKSSSNIKIGRNTFRNSWLASLWESISWFLPGQGAAPLMTSTPDEKFPPIDPDSLQVTFSQLWWFGTYNRVAGGFPAGRHSPAGLMEVLLICVSVGERVSECVRVCRGGRWMCEC